MIYNEMKLRGRIAESGLLKRDIAVKLHLSDAGFRNKLNGTNEFVLSEIEALQQVLNLDKQDLDEIFFSPKVG